MCGDGEILKHLYDRFNARDIDGALAVMHDEVAWTNGIEGGHVHGHESVRSYWQRQWTMINPHVEPLGFSTGPDGVVVEVHQTVRNLGGKQLSEKMVGHIFRIEDGLITRFDIRPARSPHCRQPP
jgi:ketosteroid isomerase-like protein